MTEYLDLADYLLIAEVVIGVPAEEIVRWPGIGRADSALHAPAAGFGGVELCADVFDKAAVLCARLARNHLTAHLANRPLTLANTHRAPPPSRGVATTCIHGVHRRASAVQLVKGRRRTRTRRGSNTTTLLSSRSSMTAGGW